MDDFVPGISYWVVNPGLRFVALICWRKQTTLLDGNCCKSEMRANALIPAQPMNRQTHRQHHTSSDRVPVRSRCSSSCSPLRGAWKIPGLLHSKHHQRCTGLLTEQGYKGSKHHLVYWEDANWYNGLIFENNLIGFVLGASLTSQLWISNATPLPAAIAQACALHHVTHHFMAFVPLVTDTVHYPITGGAQLLMGCEVSHEERKKDWRRDVI